MADAARLYRVILPVSDNRGHVGMRSLYRRAPLGAHAVVKTLQQRSAAILLGEHNAHGSLFFGRARLKPHNVAPQTQMAVAMAFVARRFHGHMNL